VTAVGQGLRALHRAGPADGPALNALARAAYAVYVPLIGREPQPMAADWRALLDRYEIWLAEEADGTLAASLALEVLADHLLIWSVAVAPARQGEGLGQGLLRFAETRARDLAKEELRLYTNAKMARNIALYRGCGYAETRREILPDRVIVHMRKSLVIS